MAIFDSDDIPDFIQSDDDPDSNDREITDISSSSNARRSSITNKYYSIREPHLSERLQFIPSMARSMGLEGTNIYDRDIHLDNILGKEVYDGKYIWILYKEGYKNLEKTNSYTSLIKLDPATLGVLQKLEEINEDIRDMEYINGYLWLICGNDGLIIKVDTVTSEIKEELIISDSREVFHQGRCSSLSTAAQSDGTAIIAWRDIDDDKKGIFSLYDKFGRPIRGRNEIPFSETGTADIDTAVLRDDTFIIVWRDNSDPGFGRFSIFDKNGFPIKGKTGILFHESETAGITAAPLNSGGFIIAYKDIRDKGKGKFTIFDSKGVPNEEKKKIAVTKRSISSITSAVLPDGNILFGWNEISDIEKGTFGIYTPKGEPVKDKEAIEFNSGRAESISITVCDSNHFVMAWKDINDGNRGKFTLFSIDGTAKKGKEKIIFYNRDIESISSLPHKDGGFILIWRNWGYGIISLFDNTGNEIKNRSGILFHEQSISEISAVGCSNGNFIITWADWYLSPKGRLALYDGDGSLFLTLKKKEKHINNWPILSEIGTDQYKNLTSIAFDKDNFYVSCPYGIFKIDPVSYETNLLVGTRKGIYHKGANSVSCAPLKNGNLVIAWADTNDSWKGKYSIYDSAGNPVEENKISIFHNSDVYHTNIIVLENGSFVIAWRGNMNEGMFSLFNEDGTALDGKSELIFFNGSHLNGIRSAALSNGTFVIAWTEGYTSQKGMFSIFTAEGNVVPEKYAIPFHKGKLNLGDITALSKNNFMIAWSDWSDSRIGKFSIYTIDGKPVPGKTKIIFSENRSRSISLSSLPKGNTVIAWSDGDDNGKGKFSLYSQDGTVLPGKNSITFDEGQSSDITCSPLRNGGFVLCWSSGSSGDSGKYAVYDHNGISNMNNLGNLFNEGTTYDFMLTTLADNTIVIVWRDNDGENTGRYAFISPHVFNSNNLIYYNQMIYNFTDQKNHCQKINPESGEITEIDLGHKIITQQVAAASPEDNKIYIPVCDSNKILALSTDTGKTDVTGIGSTNGEDTFIDVTDIDGDEMIIVSKSNDNTIYLLEGSQFAAAKAEEVEVPVNPGFIKAIGNDIFVAHQSGSAFSKIMLPHIYVETVEILLNGAMPVHAVFDGRYLWVVCKNPYRILKVDPGNRQICGKVDFDNPSVYCEFDGTNIWVLTERSFGGQMKTDGIFSLVKINRETIETEDIINLGYIMGSAEESPSMECIGPYIYLHKNIRFKYLNRININTGMIECIPVKENIDIRRSVFDGRYIWALRVNDLYKLDLEGNIIMHVGGDSNIRYRDITFDGRYIYTLKTKADTGSQIEKYDIFTDTMIKASDVTKGSPRHLYYTGTDIWTLDPENGGALTRYRNGKLHAPETNPCEARGRVNGIVFDGTSIWGLYEEERLVRRIKIV